MGKMVRVLNNEKCDECIRTENKDCRNCEMHNKVYELLSTKRKGFKKYGIIRDDDGFEYMMAIDRIRDAKYL